MRILHVIPSVGPVRGGPSQAVLEIVRALNRLEGVAAEIATTNDNGPAVLDVPAGVLTEFQGAPTWFFPRFSPPVGPLREFAFSWPLHRWLARHLQDYDLIHVHAFFSHASTTAMIMARRRRLPYLVRPLGLLCTWSLQQSALRKKIYLALVERRNLDGSRGLEYTAEQEMEEAAPLGLRAPAFVLPFGIELPAPRPEARARLRRQIGVQPDEPVILFLSRVHPKKGLHHLVEALASLADRRFSLVVAGSGPADYEAEVKAQAAAGPLANRVHFTGFAQGETKQMLLQGADFFALTSHSESFGIAVMEAMAAGIPVLITPGVPLAPLVTKFGTGWVTELDKESIARSSAGALDSLDNPGEAAARSDRCRALARNYEWDRIAARTKNVYEAVLSGRRPPSFDTSQITLETN